MRITIGRRSPGAVPAAAGSAAAAARLALVLAGALALAAPPARAQAPALARAYAHNDYRHARPLRDALDRGFDAVEADVFLVGGRLLVAHDSAELAAAPTLQALYLDPLRERVRRNGGRVQPGMPPFLLMVDVKSEAAPAYAALDALLAGYAEVVTRYAPGRVTQGAIDVVVSGHRGRAAMEAGEAAGSRLAAYDGRVEELEAAEPPSPAFMPLVSDEWKRVSDWKGVGALPAGDRRALERLVARAHAQGRKLRLWGAPDRAAAWQVLYDAGVDYINTDDLDGLRAFLLKQR